MRYLEGEEQRHMDQTLSNDELRELLRLASLATPAPWFVRQLDDEVASSMVAISAVEDTGKGERWPEFDHGKIVAATLVQNPRYVDMAGNCR
jgi:hypothetical protein